MRTQESTTASQPAELLATAQRLGQRGYFAGGRGVLALRAARGYLATPWPLDPGSLMVGEMTNGHPLPWVRGFFEHQPHARALALATLPKTAALAVEGICPARCLVPCSVELLGHSPAALELSADAALSAAWARADAVVVERFGVLLAGRDLGQIERNLEAIEYAADVTSRGGRRATLSHQALEGFAGLFEPSGISDGLPCRRCNACSLGTAGTRDAGREAASEAIGRAITDHLRK